MAITYTLPAFKLISQLNEATADGYPDENARDNCVVASISMALDYLTGGAFDGDELKDAVYGQGYVGPMSASHYEAYCAAHGVTLAPHDGSQSDLVATIHAQVDAGHPVLVTMPSQWATAPANPVSPSGSTHVGVAYGTGPGMIRVANPWGGFDQDQADDWWAARLCYGQVWVMQKESANVSGVPSGWSDDGTTLTAPNGVHVAHGFRAHILNNAWDAGNYPLGAEFSVAAPLDYTEVGNQSLGTGNVQYFRLSQLSWASPAPSFADPNGVWVTWVGQEAMVMRQMLIANDASLTTAQKAASDAQAHLATAQALIASLQQQLAAAQAQAAANAVLTPAQTAAIQAMAALKAALSAS